MSQVFDASALVAGLVDMGPKGLWVRDMARRDGQHAPYLIEYETASALRAMARRREISVDQAADALDSMLDWPMRSWAFRPFAGRIWQLRDSVSAYDAAYVSLAEFLELPLVTLDMRLAGASGLRCEVLTP